MEVVTIVLKRH